MTATAPVTTKRLLPDYRTVWRWHFYAGLFCIPFVLWLATTGSIYLFKPQIEAWLDRPYDRLSTPGASPVSPKTQVAAALAAIPGSSLHFYELPRSEGSAAQIVVGKGVDEFRVYVHPGDASVLKVENEDERPMKVVFRLHGELLAGDRGSMLVELAASWTMVMLVTGIVLWWPRDSSRMAGVLYPRINQSGRIFWRDLHSVTGLWVSGFAIVFLLTGLPWAKNWGSYFKKARAVIVTSAGRLDWTTGRASELEQRMARNGDASMQDDGMHGMHHSGSSERRFGKAARMRPGVTDPHAYDAIDRILPVVASLQLAYPVQISPPLSKDGPWTAQSDSQNRMLRDSYTLAPATAAILTHQTFYDRPWLDRAVSLGISAHEGHLFGWLNQLMNLFTATGLALLAVSSVVLWWKRRPSGVLGAPVPQPRQPISVATFVLIAVMGIYMPLMGASIIVVLLIERLVLRRIPSVRSRLGLRTAYGPA